MESPLDESLYFPALYATVTALYIGAVILRVKGGLKFGSWYFIVTLVLTVLGGPLCFLSLPGYTGLLLLTFSFFVCSLLLGKPVELLPVNNRAVLITGCDSGFGHALVQHLDSLGFTVFAGVLNERGVGADKLRRCGSERLSVLQLDVTDSAQIQTAYLRVNADVGETGLWGIVNNAGFLGCVADGEILPMKLYRKCMAVNFLGAVELTQTFLPLIRRARGRMVNISSFAGEVPIPGFAAYGASKAALSMFSEAMRQELSRWGIKVAIVQPSGFKTNIRGQKKEWESCKEEILSQLPQDVKEDYGEGYISSILGHFFQIMSVSQEDLRPVMDDIYQALMAASPQTLYTPGQLAWIIPFMHRFFPVRFSDFVIATLFGFYKHVPARLQGTSSPVNKRTG